MAYRYHDNGDLKHYTDPEGRTLEYHYDANRQLEAINLPNVGLYTVNSQRWFAPEQVTLPGGHWMTEPLYLKTGWHYNRHRYYAPELGRYITEDPIGLDGGLNTFAYVGSNPIRAIDPEGLKTFCQTLRELADKEKKYGREALAKRIMPDYPFPNVGEHPVEGGADSGSMHQNMELNEGAGHYVDFGYVEVAWAARVQDPGILLRFLHRMYSWLGAGTAATWPLHIVSEIDEGGGVKHPVGPWTNMRENYDGVVLGLKLAGEESLEKAWKKKMQK